MSEYLLYEKTDKEKGPEELPYTLEDMREMATPLPTTKDFLLEVKIERMLGDIFSKSDDIDVG